MAINEDSLIMVEGNQLLDSTIVASLAILLSSAGVTHMHQMLGPEVGVVATKAVAIRAVVMVMVVVVGRPMVEPCYGCLLVVGISNLSLSRGSTKTIWSSYSLG